MILGQFDRLGVGRADSFPFVHGLVECTKRAFLVRDAHVIDPAYMKADTASFLSVQGLEARAGEIDMTRALAWPHSGPPADTIWMGAVDSTGRAVSFIQSIYWEFGSGILLEDTGILWQNCGRSFSLEPGARNYLLPGRKPFHTLNPALAALANDRIMVDGNMGGEGQPQTQSAVFARYDFFATPLQEAVTAPRWLLGRTWGAESTTLKLESQFESAIIDVLREAGHVVEVVEKFDQQVGHAGAIVRHPNGILEGAADPRSDGAVAGF